MDEINKDIKKKAKEMVDEMEDNTQFIDTKNQLKFVKMKLDSATVDYIMDHFGFLDLAEMNMMCIKLIHIMIQIEKAGFSFAMFKTTKDVNNQETISESYKMDLNDLIYKIQLASITKKEDKKDEKSSM
jgi:hypothetical protein